MLVESLTFWTHYFNVPSDFRDIFLDDKNKTSDPSILDNDDIPTVDIPIKTSYSGPHLDFPLTSEGLDIILETFKKKKVSFKYILKSSMHVL